MDVQEKQKTFSELLNTELLVLVDFYTEWCGPCNMMKPVLQELKTTIGDKAKIVKVDVDRHIQVASQFQITGVPTLILFKNGKIVWRQSGVVLLSTLKQLIERYQ